MVLLCVFSKFCSPSEEDTGHEIDKDTFVVRQKHIYGEKWRGSWFIFMHIILSVVGMIASVPLADSISPVLLLLHRCLNEIIGVQPK
jgi:hypothetical protein